MQDSDFKAVKNLPAIIQTAKGYFYPFVHPTQQIDSQKQCTIVPGCYRYQKVFNQYWDIVAKFLLLKLGDQQPFKVNREKYMALGLSMKEEGPCEGPLDTTQYNDTYNGKSRTFFVLIYKKFTCDLNQLYQRKQYKFFWKNEQILKSIVKQMIQCVIYFHSGAGEQKTQYVHRDIKPQNFLAFLTDENEWIIKLIDYGTIKELIQVNHRKGYENTITRQGTTIYMAPQILSDVSGRQTRQLTKRIDLTLTDSWSLGVTVYKFLTGKKFYAEEGIVKKLDCVKNKQEFKKIFAVAYQDYLKQVESSFQKGDKHSSQFKGIIKQFLVNTVCYDPQKRTKILQMSIKSKYKDFYRPTKPNYNIDTRFKGQAQKQVREMVSKIHQTHPKKQTDKVMIWEDDEMTNEKLIRLFTSKSK